MRQQFSFVTRFRTPDELVPTLPRAREIACAAGRVLVNVQIAARVCPK